MNRHAGRLAAVELVGPDAPKDTTPSLKDLSIAAVTQKFCRYCKKKGHLIQECRKRARKQQEQSGPPKQKPFPSKPAHPPTPDNPADPAMKKLFNSWCAFVDNSASKQDFQ